MEMDMFIVKGIIVSMVVVFGLWFVIEYFIANRRAKLSRLNATTEAAGTISANIQIRTYEVFGENFSQIIQRRNLLDAVAEFTFKYPEEDIVMAVEVPADLSRVKVLAKPKIQKP